MAFWFVDKPRSWGLLGIGFPVVNQCGETRSHRVLIGCVERGADSLSGLPAKTMDRGDISRVSREYPAYRAEGEHKIPWGVGGWPVLVQAGRLDVVSHSVFGKPMRVQIQLRIVTDDDNVLSDEVIACFDKGDDQLEEIGLSLD
jgi:hypothetical protein